MDTLMMKIFPAKNVEMPVLIPILEVVVKAMGLVMVLLEGFARYAVVLPSSH